MLLSMLVRTDAHSWASAGKHDCQSYVLDACVLLVVAVYSQESMLFLLMDETR